MKKLLASFTLAAASLMAAAPSAHATDITSAILSDTGYSNTFFYGANTSFSDSFTFTLGATSTDLFGGAWHLLTSRSSSIVDNFKATLSSLSGTSTFNSVTVAGGYQAISFDLPLDPGSYTLTISGTSRASSGNYSLSVNAISPVPEPESYAMMLAGLAVMGAIARKRSQNKA